MKRALLIVLLSFFGIASGQKKELIKADKLFANHSYIEAAKLYLQVPPSQKILQNLGDCYYYNSQMTFAAETYERLFLQQKDSIQPEYYFRYAESLMGTKDYKKADMIMSKYLGYPVDTENLRHNINKTAPYNYQIKRISKAKNTGDFGLAFWGSKVVFASQKDPKETYKWNGKPYLDLYEGKISKAGDLQAVKPFPKEINTKKHESSATFSADGKIMYFNRNNEKRVKVGNEKISTIKIFRAEFDGQKWINITQTPFSGDTYSTQHPALSKDGKRLFFSSDRPGSLGSFDIYYVDISDNGTYSEPVNLGSKINTKRREQFPYIDEENSLYFSSDGHQGFGGLDIFMSRSNNGTYANPKNLGETINSGMDDFSYVLDKNNDTGYLSSNRGGADDIYYFSRTENEDRLLLEGTVKDLHSKEVLPGTTIYFLDEAGELITKVVVGEKGDYALNTEPNKKYRILAEKDFYIPYSSTFTTDADGKAEFNIELEIESYDDAEEIVVTKNDGYVYIELENIYFDLNKHDITPEAARTLDVLVDLLKKYPKMEIELGAHTDSRASATYNLQLSHYRAKATMDYLIKNGINSKRLRSKGYGESKPLVNCGEKCTEAENSINRRCEFIILK